MAIRRKGIIPVSNGDVDLSELECLELPDGEYGFLLFDKEVNKALPKLKYFAGVVLPTISEALPDNPPVSALYRYFEALFCKTHTCKFHGREFQYHDLKSCKSFELDEVIEKTIRYAREHWEIEIIERLELKKSEHNSQYATVYASFWQDYSRTI